MARFLILPLLALPLGACIETHVVVDQPKPLQININFSGKLDLVIHDAREDLEKITGEKPTNVVRPEDIGLPSTTGSLRAPVEEPALPAGGSLVMPAWMPVSFKAPGATRSLSSDAVFEVAAKDDVQTRMSARSARIRALWDAKLIGESHTGLLVVKGNLTEEQQKLVNDDNTDRTALYAAEAKTKGVSVDEVALGYYVARLGYAKKGAWYEKRNAKNAWEWLQWDR